VSGLSLKFSGMPLGRAFLEGTFHVVSYASTTGFAIGDNADWPMLPCFILMVVSLFCGCAGSTTGGLKVDRGMVLFKAVGRQIDRTLRPSSVSEIRIGKLVLKDEEVYPQILFIAMYFLLICISVVLALVLGDPNGHAITGTVSCLGTVGPSLGSIGSLGNYNAEPGALKVLFSLDMFLGRVEIYPVFAVLSMILHPKRK
jgi:trk system potassium uptake protein TrkH